MKKITIIIPAYNEEKNIGPVYDELKKVLADMEEEYSFELLFVNDGSSDGTMKEVEKIVQMDGAVKFIDFSRNFGKEMALTAGINSSKSDACIMIDADLQHPPQVIPLLIKKWEKGNEIVIGVRKNVGNSGLLKAIGSYMFYKVANLISEVEVRKNETDFRLVDRMVMDEFNRLTESRRMTRALINWLGFKKEYVYFDVNERRNDVPTYSFWKLLKLAIDGFISLSLLPLKLASVIGVFITLSSGLLGFYIFLGKAFFEWESALKFSGAENLAILTVFLVGIMLICLGLIALYVANIHSEVIGRPMYVIRRKKI